MTCQRPFLLLLLALAMLPWGAYAGVPVVPAGRQFVASEAALPPSLEAPHNCRGPGLIGSPCAPDLGLPPEQRVPAVERGILRLTPPETVLGDGRTAGGILDPPRRL